jgi:glycosyltransferase involved in cell wall biosynthesis
MGQKISNKTKILVLTSTFPRWEDDTTPPFVYELCKKLTKDFAITVLAPHHPGALFKEKMNGVKVCRFPYFFPLRLQKLCYEGGILPNIRVSLAAKIQVPFFMLAEFVFTLKSVLREKPALIHAHWTIPQGVTALVIKKLLHTPMLVTAHAGDVFTQNILFNWLNSLILKHADLITLNSAATKKQLLKSSKKGQKITRTEIIPMGVDFDRFKPPKERERKKLKRKLGLDKKRIILFVGRLVEKKGVCYLIKAMQKISKSLPASHLLVIGYGPEEEKLKTLTKTFNLEEKIAFLGKIPNYKLVRYYGSSDVFIAPSIEGKRGDTEGLGIVFLEAIASGTAVIGTNVGGIQEIIINKKTGLIVEQKNEDQLAKSAIKLLKNEKLRIELAENARKHAKNNFSWEIIAEKFKKIYSEI